MGPETTMLEDLELLNVGPAPRMKAQFAPRVNLGIAMAGSEYEAPRLLVAGGGRPASSFEQAAQYIGWDGLVGKCAWTPTVGKQIVNGVGCDGILIDFGHRQSPWESLSLYLKQDRFGLCTDFKVAEGCGQK